MERLLLIFLRKFIRRGSLKVTTANGRTHSFGDGSGPPIAVRFTTTAAQRAVLLDPELKLGEAYMDGTLVVERGSIADLLAVLLRQGHVGPVAQDWAWLPRLFRHLFRRLQQYNRRSRSRQNVAHHYDLDGRLYSLFLDGDRQYSCAYFESPDQSLDDAQLAKRRHLAAKLRPPAEGKVLDIGCGWGGLALYLAEIAGAEVTGITLSQEQFQVAQSRAIERGLTQDANFRLIDYRDVGGTFDRIVSVGMFEHVGVGFYDTYFGKCRELLADDGLMVLHSIGRSSPPGITNPWIAKYIFPGGYIPALSEVVPAIERAGLIVTDIEVLQLALCRDAESLARTLPCPPRRGQEAVRPAFRADVGVLPRLLGNGVSRSRYGGVPDPDRQAQGRDAADPRLHRPGGSAVARHRGSPRSAAAACRRVKIQRVAGTRALLSPNACVKHKAQSVACSSRDGA